MNNISSLYFIGGLLVICVITNVGVIFCFLLLQQKLKVQFSLASVQERVKEKTSV